MSRDTVFRCSSAGHHGASRKRARRQGRTSSPRSDEGRGARSEADVARRTADKVPYQSSSLRNLQSETMRRQHADLQQPQEAPHRRAATADSAQPEATSQVSRTRTNARERGGEGEGEGEGDDSGTAARTDLRGSPTRRRDVFARMPPRSRPNFNITVLLSAGGGPPRVVRAGAGGLSTMRAWRAARTEHALSRAWELDDAREQHPRMPARG